MIDGKVHEIISFKRSKWLEKYINFKSQKRNQAVNDFEKDFYKNSIVHSMETQWRMFVIE